MKVDLLEDETYNFNLTKKETAYIARAVELMTCCGCIEEGITKCTCICNQVSLIFQEVNKYGNNARKI